MSIMENSQLLQQQSLFSQQHLVAENQSESDSSQKSQNNSNDSSQLNTRLYIKIPQEILEKLNKHYDEIRYPTQQQMEEIGKEFGYSVEKIDNWYKRKRRNEAKLGHIQIKRKQQFSQQIKQQLNKFYEEYKVQLIRDEDIKPSTQELMRMSKIIGLTVQQIRSWFSVRRQKEYVKNQQKLKDKIKISEHKPANELNEHEEVIKKLKREEQQQTIENITFKNQSQSPQISDDLQHKQFLQSQQPNMQQDNNNSVEHQLKVQNQMLYNSLILKILNNLQPQQQQQQTQIQPIPSSSPQHNNNMVSQMLMQHQQMPITNYNNVCNNNTTQLQQSNQQYLDLLNMYKEHCQQNQMLSQRLIESLENQNQMQFNIECQKQKQLLLPQLTQQNQFILQTLLNKLQNINQQQIFVSEKVKNYNKFLEVSQQQQQLNLLQQQQQQIQPTAFFQQNQQQQFIQQQQNNQINLLIQQILSQQQQQHQQQYQF